jgi:hypothetical protein
MEARVDVGGGIGRHQRQVALVGKLDQRRSRRPSSTGSPRRISSTYKPVGIERLKLFEIG